MSLKRHVVPKHLHTLQSPSEPTATLLIWWRGLYLSFVLDLVRDTIDSDFVLDFLYSFDESRSRSSDSNRGDCARGDAVDEYSTTAARCCALDNRKSASSYNVSDTRLSCSSGRSYNSVSRVGDIKDKEIVTY